MDETIKMDETLNDRDSQGETSLMMPDNGEKLVKGEVKVPPMDEMSGISDMSPIGKKSNKD